jgi:hypothetical protein
MYWMYQSLNTAESTIPINGMVDFGLLLKEREWRFNTPTAKAQLNQWVLRLLT